MTHGRSQLPRRRRRQSRTQWNIHCVGLIIVMCSPGVAMWFAKCPPVVATTQSANSQAMSVVVSGLCVSSKPHTKIGSLCKVVYLSLYVCYDSPNAMY